MSTVTNAIGQKIQPGDPVVYYGWQWHERKGTFCGLTGRSDMVRIELDQKVRKIRNIHNGKVFSTYAREPWDRNPRDWYRHKANGYFLPSSEYYKLPWQVRHNEWEQDTGVLRRGYKFVEVPAYFTGPMGTDRLFKLEQ